MTPLSGVRTETRVVPTVLRDSALTTRCGEPDLPVVRTGSGVEGIARKPRVAWRSCRMSSGWRRRRNGILASRSWSKPQRDWLQRIANQTKAITIVDREALDDDALLFRREGGGWPRLNKLFGGELDGVLQQFQREVWAA